MRNKWIKKIKAVAGCVRRGGGGGGVLGVFVLHEWEGAAGMRLDLWGWWTLRSKTEAFLSSGKADTVSHLSFAKWFHPPHPPNPTHTLTHSPPPPLPFDSNLHLFCFYLFFVQLPSPTAMSTALRGISCYLREVSTRFAPSLVFSLRVHMETSDFIFRYSAFIKATGCFF